MLLKIAIAIIAAAVLFGLLPTSIAIIVGLSVAGLALLDVAVRGFFAGNPFWQVVVMFTEPFDYHSWQPLDELETRTQGERFGIRDVEAVMRCSDCSAVQVRARDADGREFVAYADEWRAKGLRIGPFVRIAKFTPVPAAAIPEPQPASSES